MLLNCGVGEDSWESLGLQGDPTSQYWRKSVLNIHWNDWCWCWNSNTLATCCKELTHLKWPWCWERLKADLRGWDGWMASPTRWTASYDPCLLCYPQHLEQYLDYTRHSIKILNKWTNEIFHAYIAKHKLWAKNMKHPKCYSHCFQTSWNQKTEY